MKIDFLIVCNLDEGTQDFLQALIADSLVGTDDEESQFNVQLTVVRPMHSNTTSNPRIICGFMVEFFDDLAEPNEAVEVIITALKGGKERHVLKFFDDLMLEENIRHYREIFELEMRLRKAISLVYLAACEGRYYDLLRDDQMQIARTDKPTDEVLKNASENELFHLLFSQYIQLNQRRRPAKVEDVLMLVTNMTTYDAFRDEITRQPIQNESDQSFLASLKSLLESVEKLRNAVAHNRALSETLRANYTQAKEKLSEAIDAYIKFYKPSAVDDIDFEESDVSHD